MPRNRTLDRSAETLPTFYVRRVGPGPSGYQVFHRSSSTPIGPPMAQGQAIELARSLDMRSRRRLVLATT